MDNLDIKCAECAESIAASSEETAITSSLGVLEEQGLYTFFLFLEAKNHKTLKDECEAFLRKIPNSPLLADSKNGDLFKRLRDLAQNPDNLLLARDLLVQTLIYARYHAKARKKTGGDR